MAKRKERIKEIRREDYEKRWQILNPPERKNYSCQKDFLIDLQEYNIQKGNFCDCGSGEPLDPSELAIRTFRRIMSELTTEEVEGWTIALCMEGDMICIEPFNKICLNGTYYHVSASIYEGDIDMYEYKDTPECWKDGSAKPHENAFSITRLREWLKAMNDKYNISNLQKKINP